jgi:hypothetical protein
LGIVPGQAAALFELARLDEQEGRPDKAVAGYRAALESDVTLDAARDAIARLTSRR